MIYDDTTVHFEDDERFALSSSALMTSIATALERICTKGEFFGRSRDIPTCFVSTTRPLFGLTVYVEHVMENFCCSKAAFVLTLVYLDRLSMSSYDMDITYSNVHRLFVSALVLAIKYIDDDCYKLSWYSRIGGLTSAAELSILEHKLLTLLDFDLFVSTTTYESYKVMLMKLLLSNSELDTIESIPNDKKTVICAV